MRFYSPHANLRLQGGPNGTVRFMGGGYETDNEAEIEWLKAHPDFGLRFFVEDPRAKAVPKKPPASAVPEPVLDEEKEQLRRENAELKAKMDAMNAELEALRKAVLEMQQAKPRARQR